jgi:hypothetical protein
MHTSGAPDLAFETWKMMKPMRASVPHPTLRLFPVPSSLYSVSMVFTKRLREGVIRGDITCSVRIWISPRVIVGNRYRMGDGEIEIESITPIGFPDITPALARESGFTGVLDLLKVAKHGKGDNIYLIRFHYIPPRSSRAKKPASTAKHD